MALTARKIAEFDYLFETTLEGLRTSYLSRIATATEAMAKGYVELQKEVERQKANAQFWKARTDDARDERDAANRKITALRGVITRMKRKEAGRG